MGSIRVRGARQNNLAGIDVELDTDSFVVFCGRSGSGKSSFAFDTLHAEGQRRYLEALSSRLRQAAGTLPRPEVDLITGLPPTVALAQHAGGTGRATVGTYVELEHVWRVLFARIGVMHDPVSGEAVRPVTHDEIVADLMNLAEGSRLLLEAPVRVRADAEGLLDEVARAGFSRVRVGGEVERLERVSAADLSPGDVLRIVVDRIRVGPGRRDRISDAVRTASHAGSGVIVAVVDEEERTYVDRPYVAATDTLLPALRPQLFVAPGPDACELCEGTGELGDGPCPTCDASGLGQAARAVRVHDVGITQVLRTPVADLLEAISPWPRGEVSGPLLAEIVRRLELLVDVGLSHLRLGTRVRDIATGEQQRLRLVRQVSARLSGVLVVLDEPTAGLDDERVGSVISLLRELREQGNGLVVVEHHPLVVAAADRVIEFGPGAGRLGGNIIYDGSPAGLADADTPTGRGQPAMPTPSGAAPSSWMTLEGPRGRNLAVERVRVPRGVLTVIGGPSGSGKTALLDSLAGHLRTLLLEHAPPPGRLEGADGIVRVLDMDATRVGRGQRSMPATYVGFWGVMRELLAATTEAQVRGFTASNFSLSTVGGRCEHCKGLGERRVELGYLPSVHVVCEVCGGQRFTRDVLEVRWRGRSAAELLASTVDEARPLLAGHPRLDEALRALQDTGLGYVQLGQPTRTLSGGEARRLKLARELVRAYRRGAEDTVFVLDGPAVGLHPVDVASLVSLLQRLVRERATVVVASHHPQLLAAADHRIRMGPGVGDAGGRVL